MNSPLLGQALGLLFGDAYSSASQNISSSVQDVTLWQYNIM
jgi:hypothetical protein